MENICILNYPVSILFKDSLKYNQMLLNCALLIPHVLKVDYNCEIVFLEETWISTYLKIYCIVYNVTDDQPMTKIYSVILDIVDDARCNHSFIFPF